MPWGLKRFQQTRQIHFLTFSCYHRQPKFTNASACETFVDALERGRQNYNLCVYGYIVMPEHVHLLVNEPERSTLAQAIKSLKQGVARRLALRAEDSFWQARYYDFNVWSEKKFVEKLRYIHRNPVRRGLVCSRNNGRGAAFVTMFQEPRASWKSSRNGPRERGSFSGSRRSWRIEIKFPALSLQRTQRPRTGHPRTG